MPSQQEQKTGMIDSFYDDDSGQIKEAGSNSLYDFFNPGARLEFLAKENITFLKITTPSGKVIIRDIGKPN
jgi:hypothetical protein